MREHYELACEKAKKILKDFTGIKAEHFEVESYLERDGRIVYLLRPRGHEHLVKVKINERDMTVEYRAYQPIGVGVAVYGHEEKAAT